MKALIILLAILLMNLSVMGQRGFSFGFDFGKSISLNSLLFQNKELETRIRNDQIYNSYARKHFTLRFPNIVNLGGIAEYRGMKKSFWRFKYSHTTNWLMFSEKPSTLDQLFPAKDQKKYSQTISLFTLSRNRQFLKKNGFLSLGFGAHVAVYKPDVEGKETFNADPGNTEKNIFLTSLDSTISVSQVSIYMFEMPFATPVGLNCNLEYSYQFSKAGRISFYIQAYVNLTKSNLWLQVDHNSERYRRDNGSGIRQYDTVINYYRFTNNPLQLGIIYYFPPLKLNSNIKRDDKP
jgi:hypothetical protein